MFKILDLTNKDLIAISINGKVEKSDYDKILPLMDKTKKDFSKIRLYIQIDNVDGIEPKAFREDIKAYLKHFKDISKTAIVGESDWHKLWANLASPFISGEVKFFPQGAIVEAKEWIMEDDNE